MLWLLTALPIYFSFQTFLLMAVPACPIALLGLWKPRAVFSHADDRPQARGAGVAADLKTLVRQRASANLAVLAAMMLIDGAYQQVRDRRRWRTRARRC
jgi:hypothetical protein